MEKKTDWVKWGAVLAAAALVITLVTMVQTSSANRQKTQDDVGQLQRQQQKIEDLEQKLDDRLDQLQRQIDRAKRVDMAYHAGPLRTWDALVHHADAKLKQEGKR